VREETLRKIRCKPCLHGGFHSMLCEAPYICFICLFTVIGFKSFVIYCWLWILFPTCHLFYQMQLWYTFLTSSIFFYKKKNRCRQRVWNPCEKRGWKGGGSWCNGYGTLWKGNALGLMPWIRFVLMYMIFHNFFNCILLRHVKRQDETWCFLHSFDIAILVL